LRLLNAFEQVEHIDMLIRREENLAMFHLPSKVANHVYLKAIYNALLLADIDAILNKPNGFKYIFLNCSDHLEEVLPLAQLYFSLFRRIEEEHFTRVSLLMNAAIAEKGAEINSKMHRPR
jgi:hypothetical protein